MCPRERRSREKEHVLLVVAGWVEQRQEEAVEEASAGWELEGEIQRKKVASALAVAAVVVWLFVEEAVAEKGRQTLVGQCTHLGLLLPRQSGEQAASQHTPPVPLHHSARPQVCVPPQKPETK